MDIARVVSRRSEATIRVGEQMSAPVVHFEIISADAARLQDFYRNIFGWKIDANNPMNYGMVDTGAAGRGIPGGVGAPSPEGGGYLTFYIEVASIDATLAKVLEVGGAVVMPKTAVPSGPTIAQFRDPVGYRIGLVEADSMPAQPARAKPVAAKAKPKSAPKRASAVVKKKAPSKAKPKSKPKKKPAKAKKAKGRRR